MTLYLSEMEQVWDVGAKRTGQHQHLFNICYATASRAGTRAALVNEIHKILTCKSLHFKVGENVVLRACPVLNACQEVKLKKCVLDQKVAAERKNGGSREQQFQGDLRTEASERMRAEEVEMVPTDNLEVLLEREAERSGGIWREMQN